MPRLLANYSLLSASEIAGKLLTFAALGYLTRVLGRAGFGEIEIAANYLMCAGLVVDLGFGPYGAREIARDPARTRELVGEIVAVRLILALAAYAILAAIGLWFAPSAIVGRLLLVYGLSLLGMPLLLQWVFQGHDAMLVVAMSTLLRQATYAAVVFACVAGAANVLRVGVAECAAVVAGAVFCTVFYLRRFGGLPRVSLRYSPRLIREGGAIGLSQLFWAARMYGGVIVLGYVATVGEVGLFASASRILLAVHTFVWLYFFNLLPTLTRAWHESAAAFNAVNDRSLRLVGWLVACGGIVWVLAAPRAAPLAFGADFAAAARPLQWLAGVCVAAAINGHYRYGLIAAGRQATEMRIQAAGALVTALGIPIGYRLAGPAGAAAGVLASEVVIWIAGWFCAQRALGVRRQGLILARPLAACLGAAIVTGLMSSQSPWFQASLAGAMVTALAIISDGPLRKSLSSAIGGLRAA